MRPRHCANARTSCRNTRVSAMPTEISPAAWGSRPQAEPVRDQTAAPPLPPGLFLISPRTRGPARAGRECLKEHQGLKLIVADWAALVGTILIVIAASRLGGLTTARSGRLTPFEPAPLGAKCNGVYGSRGWYLLLAEVAMPPRIRV